MGSVGSFAAKKVFKKIDKNHNGELDAKEVSQAMDIINMIFNKVLHIDAIQEIILFRKMNKLLNKM